MNIIKPTNGRVVWYTPNDEDVAIRLASPESGLPYLPGMAYDESPLAALVCAVHGDRMINVLVIDGNGVLWPRRSVTLVQEGDPVPPAGRYCQWMPYQIGQALAAESLNPPSMKPGTEPINLAYDERLGSNEPGRDPK